MKVLNRWKQLSKDFESRKPKSIRLNNRSLFLKRIGELLEEGYTFSESIHLVLPFHTDQYKETSHLIHQLIRNGDGISEIFKLLGFSNRMLVSLYVAEESGDIAKCLAHQAKYLSSITETKKKMQQILTYPLVLFLFLSGMMVGFRNYFLPNLLSMQTEPNEESSLFIKLLPYVAVRLPDVFIGIFAILILAGATSFMIYRFISPRKKVMFINRVPLFNRFFFLWKTQQITLELGSLLNSGLTIQDGLAVLKQQNNDLLLQEISRQLRYHVQRGEPFHVAVRLQSYLPKEFPMYIQHGETSGHLATELLLYSDNLMNYLEGKMNSSFQFIQPMMFLIIAICIIAAYLALLLPMYQMIDSI